MKSYSIPSLRNRLLLTCSMSPPRRVFKFPTNLVTADSSRGSNLPNSSPAVTSESRVPTLKMSQQDIRKKQTLNSGNRNWCTSAKSLLAHNFSFKYDKRWFLSSSIMPISLFDVSRCFRGNASIQKKPIFMKPRPVRTVQSLVGN